MNELFTRAYTKIVAKAWSDAEFKKRLLSDPNAVLKENGIEIPQGVQFKVMEDTNQLVHLVLPPPPDEIDIEELGKVAGGGKKMCKIY